MPTRKMSDEQRDEAVRLREESGLSIGVIAKTFGVSRGCIDLLLLMRGADPRRPTRACRTFVPGAIEGTGTRLVRRFTDAEDATILEMRIQGVSVSAIGRTLQPPRRRNSVTARLATLARHEARAEAAQARASRNRGPVAAAGLRS